MLNKYLATEWLFLGFIFILSCFLLLANLGNHYLWQDEAQTAVIAKTVLSRGLPHGTDGVNYFSQENGAEYGPNYIWKWHTWLPFYILAGFYKLFGVNTFTSRLPFALFGVGIFPLLYFYTADLFKNKRIAVFTIILLIACIPFLLLLRQCRYYSMTAFFSILGLYSYQLILERHKFSILLFILAGTLLFHTHYVYFATLLAAVGLHCLLFHRDRWRHVGLACIVSIVLSLPWIIWLSSMHYNDRYGDTIFRFYRSIAIIILYICQIHLYVTPTYLFLTPPLILLVYLVLKKPPYYSKNNNPWRQISAPVLFACITITALACTCPAPFFRYLSSVIPVLFLMAGVILDYAYQLRWYVALGLLALLVSLQPLFDFGYELTHDYDGPIEGIVKFLDENAQPDDIVAITYGDMPLKFYTDLRIVGGLTGEDLSPAKNAKWMIIRQHTICSKDKIVAEYLRQNINFENCFPIEINYPDIPFENREMPKYHNFRTPIAKPNVIIYEKMQESHKNEKSPIYY